MMERIDTGLIVLALVVIVLTIAFAVGVGIMERKAGRKTPPTPMFIEVRQELYEEDE